jgi:hypothetical protein
MRVTPKVLNLLVFLALFNLCKTDQVSAQTSALTGRYAYNSNGFPSTYIVRDAAGKIFQVSNFDGLGNNVNCPSVSNVGVCTGSNVMSSTIYQYYSYGDSSVRDSVTFNKAGFPISKNTTDNGKTILAATFDGKGNEIGCFGLFSGTCSGANVISSTAYQYYSYGDSSVRDSVTFNKAGFPISKNTTDNGKTILAATFDGKGNEIGCFGLFSGTCSGANVISSTAYQYYSYGDSSVRDSVTFNKAGFPISKNTTDNGKTILAATFDGKGNEIGCFGLFSGTCSGANVISSTAYQYYSYGDSSVRDSVTFNKAGFPISKNTTDNGKTILAATFDGKGNEIGCFGLFSGTCSGANVISSTRFNYDTASTRVESVTYNKNGFPSSRRVSDGPTLLSSSTFNGLGFDIGCYGTNILICIGSNVTSTITYQNAPPSFGDPTAKTTTTFNKSGFPTSGQLLKGALLMAVGSFDGLGGNVTCPGGGTGFDSYCTGSNVIRTVVYIRDAAGKIVETKIYDKNGNRI